MTLSIGGSAQTRCTLANSAKDPRSKAAMLQIAAEYDGLAEMAEERSKDDPKPAP